jgi:hypothetical protein
MLLILTIQENKLSYWNGFEILISNRFFFLKIKNKRDKRGTCKDFKDYVEKFYKSDNANRFISA